MDVQHDRGDWLDSIGSLYDWLGALIAETPSIRDCGVFAIDGDGLRTEHFHWTDDDGSDVPIDDATSATICTALPDARADIFRLQEEIASMREEIQRLREGATSGVTLDQAYDIAEKIAEDYSGSHVGDKQQQVMTEQLVKRIARSIYEPKAEIPPEDEG